jgi:hypothetical protein
LAPTVGIATTGFCYPGEILQLFSSTRSTNFATADSSNNVNRFDLSSASSSDYRPLQAVDCFADWIKKSLRDQYRFPVHRLADYFADHIYRFVCSGILGDQDRTGRHVSSLPKSYKTEILMLRHRINLKGVKCQISLHRQTETMAERIMSERSNSATYDSS